MPQATKCSTCDLYKVVSKYKKTLGIPNIFFTVGSRLCTSACTFQTPDVIRHKPPTVRYCVSSAKLLFLFSRRIRRYKKQGSDVCTKGGNLFILANIQKG